MIELIFKAVTSCNKNVIGWGMTTTPGLPNSLKFRLEYLYQ